MTNVPKFIKVNEIYSDKTVTPLMINTAFITSVKKAKHGDTMINMAGERTKADGSYTVSIFYFVKETVAEVEAML